MPPLCTHKGTFKYYAILLGGGGSHQKDHKRSQGGKSSPKDHRGSRSQGRGEGACNEIGQTEGNKRK